ncbi:hypothetical protein [Paraglaciecola marina]|uniref:hypothetical protein n=1 Tax=Paraglaciecola marina TaxID=2500157 RepID=UPI00105D05D9|nr:hypothetical protein [Paraglaciecola marina]
MNISKRPPNDPSDKELELGIGATGFTFKGSVGTLKGLSFWILSVAVSAFVIITILFYANGYLGSYFDPKTSFIEDKKTKIAETYPIIKKVISTYDEYLGYAPLSNSGEHTIETEGVEFLKNNIEAAIYLFESTSPHDFDSDFKFKLWIWHHQALMFLIHGDILADQRSLLTALYSINKASEMITIYYSESVNIAQDDSWIKTRNTQITRDKFIILILNYNMFGHRKYLEEALLIFEKFGGCDYLLKQNILHRRVYDTVDCDPRFH